MLVNRFSIVPVLSSAARMPLPAATIASSVSFNNFSFISANTPLKSVRRPNRLSGASSVDVHGEFTAHRPAQAYLSTLFGRITTQNGKGPGREQLCQELGDQGGAGELK